MHCVTILGTFLAMMAFADAWWLFDKQKTRIQPLTGIEEGCVRAAQNGDCEFYRCMERRYPCHDNSFATNHGLVHCERYKQNLHSFDQRGQAWVRSSQRCLTRRFLENYSMSSQTCHNLNKLGWDNISKCYLGEGFCSIAWDNRDILWQVFRTKELAHTLRAWKELLQVTRECTGVTLRRFLKWGLVKLTEIYGINGNGYI